MSGRSRLAIIAAVADNDVIGADGAMPWRLSTDLRRFKEMTLGKAVIMGRHTWVSLKKPLADRLNIVVSRDPKFRADGAVVARSLDEAEAIARDWARAHHGDEIMVIGGGVLYAEAIGRAERLYLTHVRSRPAGDTLFPKVDPAAWRAVARESFPPGEQDTAATEFVVYERSAR